jgi:acetyl-CoA acetyltransferase
VRIRAQAMTTDAPATFEAQDMREVVGYSMAARRRTRSTRPPASAPATWTWSSCTTALRRTSCCHYEALGLCEPGGCRALHRDGDNTYGGRVVTNPSGGLLSKGHPLGATGLAQCARAGAATARHGRPRQVPNARLALQHNLGLGGACVVTLYEKA